MASDKPSPPNDAGSITVSAAIEVRIDRDRAANAGVASHEVADALEVFLRNHENFDLSDLEDIRVRVEDRKTIALKEVASIIVHFQKKK
jgi:multidrug efflux pump subunit AcrB